MTRRILVAVSGLTPQILTETLYALAVDAEEKWIPDEIHLITTVRGKDNAALNLLSGKGWFHQLRRDYNLPAIAFDAENHIHLIVDAAGNPLEDIRTPADNEAAADTITREIRRLTGENETEVHVSIAGGRKTMGYYAGYALSLFGRDQDRLSHVLVSAPYESHRDFFTRRHMSMSFMLTGRRNARWTAGKQRSGSQTFLSSACGTACHRSCWSRMPRFRRPSGPCCAPLR